MLSVPFGTLTFPFTPWTKVFPSAVNSMLLVLLYTPLLGMYIDVKLLQPLQMLLAIEVTLDGMLKRCMF